MKGLAMWEVVIWFARDKFSRGEFDTRELAYLHANSYSSFMAIEIYGPSGEYDAIT